MGTHSLSVPLYDEMLKDVGDEEEIAMMKTTIDISDRLYNMMIKAIINRRSTGSLREGLVIPSSDVDILYYLTDHHVVWDVTESLDYNLWKQTVILAEYQESIPGTVYLCLLNIHPSYFKPVLSCVQKNSYLSSSLFLEGAYALCQGSAVIKHGPCYTHSVYGQEGDMTVGFAAREWPTQQTKHWLTRCEKFGWPQKNVLESILSSGCHFVPIGSKQSRQENDPNLELEWRVSFNQAEQMLIDSMTHCQFLCYALLKMFLKEVLNKNVREEEKLLCSYFLKTAMFWCIQIDPVHEWSRENFYPCFWKCFKMLLQWVYTGYCPIFFIPENNLFVCTIVGANQERLFTQMYDLYCLRENCLAQSPSLQKVVNKILANPKACTKLLLEECFDEYKHDALLNYMMTFINALQYTLSNYDWDSLYKVSRLNISNMSNFEKVLIGRHVLNIYNQIAFVEQRSCICGTHCTRNKQTYGKHKKVGARLVKLTAEFGCATDPLYLALYQYNDGRFKCALNILEETRKRLYQDYIIYWNLHKYKVPVAYKETMIGQPKSLKIKEAMAFEIKITTSMQFCELDIEIALLQCNKRERTLTISLFVFLRFLIFLCHHRLQSPLADHSLQELHSLVHTDDDRYIVISSKDIVWNILGICHHMAGNLDKAFQAYHTSLKQIPDNSITEATKFRLLHLESQLESKGTP